MARVTVEHELKKIKNPFELVKKATKRAYELARGATSSLYEEKNRRYKPTVLALKEISEGHIK